MTPSKILEIIDKQILNRPTTLCEFGDTHMIVHAAVNDHVGSRRPVAAAIGTSYLSPAVMGTP